MVTSTSREKCEGCCKEIFQHYNRIVICAQCDKIYHAKCSNSTVTFNQIKNLWTCWECTDKNSKRYNPFDSIFYDKYQDDDSEVREEINRITGLLEKCNSYNLKSIDKILNSTQDDNHCNTLSVMFNNIDGVQSNFDKLHAELSSINNKFNIITLAETNIDSSHKNLFNLPGYQSVYQSKVVHKQKGSGLGRYLDIDFIFDTIDECSQCSKDIESL